MIPLNTAVVYLNSFRILGLIDGVQSSPQLIIRLYTKYRLKLPGKRSPRRILTEP
ncbi:hypothetical protein D3C74_490460 [compost metagenome]